MSQGHGVPSVMKTGTWVEDTKCPYQENIVDPDQIYY